MRLTLRTLLAYLDNTLDAQDAEALRLKLEQSGFATQLVQRIRASLADPTLSAPAPDSVHPIEEPNMMSDFLDSTLSPEQIAEVEKACLESPPHLAEAAACHQILTMVLVKPAEVSDDLRERVFSMVDLDGKILISDPAPGDDRPNWAIAGEIGPRYSDIDLGTEGPSPASPSGPSSSGPPPIAADGAEVDTPEVQSGSVHQGSEAFPPVSVDDSGVFHAASKLREQSHQFAEAGTAMDDAEDASNARPFHQIQPADLVNNKASSFRVAPWVISVALVALLLFAIVQIFAPLVAPKVADRGEEKLSQGISEKPAPPSETGAPAGETASGIIDANGEPESAEIAAGSQDQKPGRAEDRSADLAADESTPPDEAGDQSSSGEAPGQMNDAEDSAGPAVPPADDSDPKVSEMPEERIAAVPDREGDGNKEPEMKDPDAAEGTAEMGSADVGPADEGPGVIAAKLVSDDVLVAHREGDGNWQLMPPESEANTNSLIACGPEYRAEFLVASPPDVTMTAVGPAEFRWLKGDETVNLRVRYGRGIVKLASSGESIQLAVGLATFMITTESENAVIGFDIRHLRDLGEDPLVPANHRSVVDLIAVNGDFAIGGFRNEVVLPSGSVATYDLSSNTDDDALVVATDSLPMWLDPEVDLGSLETDAATDLFELVQSDGSDSLVLSLRSALQFRRNEVAALAGKTMLALGDPTAYFGLDGLLSNPRQRLYWSSHLDAVRQMMDRSVTDATAVRTAIAGSNGGVDDADGDTLFRLLRGYSQEQLENGGDAELVADLESASVPVRVLASESLRDISGTTLFFRPEEEVASRRDDVVKKWKVRLRKESIRYPESE